MNGSTRSAIVTSSLTAFVLLAAVAGASFASDSEEERARAAKKKAVFSKQQKKELNKLIAAAVKKNPGPAGANGATGAKGETGAQGPAVAPLGIAGTNPGASAAFGPILTSPSKTVLSKAMPAGKYIVNVNIGVNFDTTVSGRTYWVQCSAVDTDGPTTLASNEADGTSHVLPFDVRGANFSLPLVFALDAATDTTLAVRCIAAYDSDSTIRVLANDGRMNAVRVSDID
jgi:hypothetical protein